MTVRDHISLFRPFQVNRDKNKYYPKCNQDNRPNRLLLFDISIDQYIFPDDHSGKSSTRRQVDSLLDKLNDRELAIIAATADALCKAREPEA